MHTEPEVQADLLPGAGRDQAGHLIQPPAHSKVVCVVTPVALTQVSVSLWNRHRSGLCTSETQPEAALPPPVAPLDLLGLVSQEIQHRKDFTYCKPVLSSRASIRIFKAVPLGAHLGVQGASRLSSRPLLTWESLFSIPSCRLSGQLCGDSVGDPEVL